MEPYQEPVTTTILIFQMLFDIGPTPRIDIPNDDDDNDEDYNEEEDEDDVLGINDGTDSDNDFIEFCNINDEYCDDPVIE